MSENLSAAAEALGTPEAIVQRSATARAKADGVAVEEVLAAWAGGTSAPVAASPEPVAPAPEETVAAPAEVIAPAPAVPDPVPETRVVPSRPVPETVGIDDASEWESVVTVRTSGLKERTRTRVSSWLTIAFVILPLAGLLYLLQFSAGPDCGGVRRRLAAQR